MLKNVEAMQRWAWIVQKCSYLIARVALSKTITCPGYLSWPSKIEEAPYFYLGPWSWLNGLLLARKSEALG